MLSQKEIAQLMSQSDVFIFPSRAEGSARVIFEAMGAGCAVICTPNSGSAMQDGIGGKLIPINDTKALEEIVSDVLQNPIKYTEYGRTNKQLIVNHYTQTSYGDGMEKVYAL
jgi:glycosyltransferase involved in cell wall biosynthesis